MKNVHAFLRSDHVVFGDEVALPPQESFEEAGWVEVTYNPKQEGAWVFRANRDQKVPTHTPALCALVGVRINEEGKRRPVVFVKF